MKNYIWDGEIDMGWEDMKSYLIEVSNKFIQKVLILANQSNNIVVKKLVNEKSAQRFEAVIDALSENMEDIFYYTYEDLEGNAVSGLKMKSWILLGTATEVVLQVFLSIYIEDYQSANWQQWEEFSETEVKNAIFATLNKLMEEGKIKREYVRSIKDAVCDEIKYHIKIHPIERIMLDEIISFYEKNRILDKDDIEILRSIQKNRNCIHAYMDREIGLWSQLQYCIRFFCALIETLIFRMTEET